MRNRRPVSRHGFRGPRIRRQSHSKSKDSCGTVCFLRWMTCCGLWMIQGLGFCCRRDIDEDERLHTRRGSFDHRRLSQRSTRTHASLQAYLLLKSSVEWHLSAVGCSVVGQKGLQKQPMFDQCSANLCDKRHMSMSSVDVRMLKLALFFARHYHKPFLMGNGILHRRALFSLFSVPCSSSTR